jgi:phosphoesterase RecJ-like protein
VLISIFMRETGSDGNIKISLRSRRGVNVCELAQKFGGGGHKYASGCRVNGAIDLVLRQFLDAARQTLS